MWKLAAADYFKYFASATRLSLYSRKSGVTIIRVRLILEVDALAYVFSEPLLEPSLLRVNNVGLYRRVSFQH